MPRCYANPNPIFQPAMRLIAAITQSFPMTVTTTFAHQYKDGTIVRLDIPPADGMQQADQLTGPILVTSPTTFTIPIDSTDFDAFAIPGSPPPAVNICAQVVPIGEVDETLQAATVNVLPFP
jgi:hypothetical protein